MRIILAAFCCVLFFFSTVADAKIVFGSKGDSGSEIYVMNDDGSHLTLLTDKPVFRHPHHPRWSPDGTQIVFGMPVNLSGNNEYHLFLMNANGTNIRPLTEAQVGINTEPSFSPNGKRVLFTTDTFRRRGTNILDLESGEMIHLPDLVANSSDWSPDGRQIVFASPSFSVAGGPGSDIWMMDTDGGNARNLLPAPDVDGRIIDRSTPRWSPDGRQILYAETEYTFEQRGVFEFLVLKANRYIISDQNGEHILQLNISKKWKSRDIDWMGDGESILLSAAELKLNRLMLSNNASYNIYKYHIATNKMTQLTDPTRTEWEVNWVRGDALAVFPMDKIPTQWGKIKEGAPNPK